MPSQPESPGEAIARLVESKGIRDPRLLEALKRVPRTWFVSPLLRYVALDDRPLGIGLDQTISQPYMVAVMTLELALSGTERVLEIGTGSGYQTAVLAELAAEVYTIERHRPLSLRARSVLDGLGYTNIRFQIGDGTLGWPEHAPFDRVLVTAGGPSFPTPLIEQLADDGRAVAPLGDEELQQLTLIRKQAGEVSMQQLMPCRFVKLIGEQGWSETN
jgi:protein-L-isoaspartate(D-aspartate) O-methyltransferase